MLEFIQNNIGTLAVGAVLLAIIAAAAWRVISDKRKGRSSCSCGCSGCPNAGLCHAAADNKTAE